MSGLKLEDLTWGALNNLHDTKQSQLTGDPRRTSTVSSLKRGAAAAFEPDAIGNRTQYTGFVVAQVKVDYATYQNKGSILQEHVLPGDREENTGAENIAYKVYIPEIEPRPAPTSSTDPILRTYPNVFSQLATKDEIALGSLVVVEYEDPTVLHNPQIVRLLEKAVGLENINVDAAGNALGNTFSGGTPNLIGTGSPEGTGNPGGGGPVQSESAPLAGTDTSCTSYNDGGMKVKGSEYQTGTKLHENNWPEADWPTNTVSKWVLPIKPSESKSGASTHIPASSGFNRLSSGDFHGALDISAKTGTPLYAVQDGTVVQSPQSLCRDSGASTAGNMFQMKTVEGIYVLYIHLDRPSALRTGNEVKKGQLVGYVGDTGKSEGEHLHWAVGPVHVEGSSARYHPADFYPASWITLPGGAAASAEHRQSLPNVVVPDGAKV